MNKSLRFLESLLDEEVKTLLFDEVGKLATNGDQAAQLYWMALAKLTTESEKGRKMTPTEVHNQVAKLVKEVYGEEEKRKMMLNKNMGGWTHG